MGIGPYLGNWIAPGLALLDSIFANEEHKKAVADQIAGIEAQIGTPLPAWRIRRELEGVGSRNVNRLRQYGQQAEQGYADRESDILGDLDARMAEEEAGGGFLTDAVLGTLGDTEQDVVGGYGDLRTRLLDYLAAESGQQEADISERYEGIESDTQQGLAARGLAGTIIPGQSSLGVERERSGELRRLHDDLQRRYADVDYQTSSAGLSARERLGAVRAAAQQSLGENALDRYGRNTNFRTLTQSGLSGDRLNAIERWRQALSGAQYEADAAPVRFDEGQRNALIDFQSNIQHQAPPSVNNALYQFGDQSAGQPEEPNWFESFMGGAGPGVGTGIGAGVGSALASGGGFASFLPFLTAITPCIDIDALVRTLRGVLPLRDVQLGDYVLTPTGVFDRVVDKSITTSPKRNLRFVRIHNDLDELICTEDHIVGDLPAGQWPGAKPAKPRPCGDLQLSISDEYIANGMHVTSMIGALKRAGVATAGIQEEAIL